MPPFSGTSPSAMATMQAAPSRLSAGRLEVPGLDRPMAMDPALHDLARVGREGGRLANSNGPAMAVWLPHSEPMLVAPRLMGPRQAPISCKEVSRLRSLDRAAIPTPASDDLRAQPPRPDRASAGHTGRTVRDGSPNR